MATMAMAVAMPVTFAMMSGILGVLDNSLRVACHQRIALAHNRFSLGVLGNVANFFQRVVQISMALAMVGTVICAMVGTMSMAVAVHIAMVSIGGHIGSESRRNGQCQCCKSQT